MSEFTASLLREKFIIHGATGEEAPLIALSNRLTLPLVSEDGKIREDYILRAQNMHMTMRVGGYMAREFFEGGLLMSREPPFDWSKANDAVASDYEKAWNPKRWLAVYHRGRVVFETGAEHRHPFLDIIEQCSAVAPGDYQKALEVAKVAFQQAGKKAVVIDYNGHVAVTLNITPAEARCATVLRGATQVTNFFVTARRKGENTAKVSQGLTVSAAFLEAAQLAFFIGIVHQKLQDRLIDHAAPEAKQAEAASDRLKRLNKAIDQFEKTLDVSYLPERPNFSKLVFQAQEFSRKRVEEEAAQETEKRLAKSSQDRAKLPPKQS